MISKGNLVLFFILLLSLRLNSQHQMPSLNQLTPSEYKEAKQRLVSLLPTAEKFQALVDLAYLELQVSNYSASVDYYLEAIKLKPINSQLYFNVADVYFRWGKNREAIDYYKKASKLGYGKEDVLYNIALAFRNLSQLDSALFFLDSLVVLYPVKCEYKYLKANTHLLLMQMEEHCVLIRELQGSACSDKLKNLINFCTSEKIDYKEVIMSIIAEGYIKAAIAIIDEKIKENPDSAIYYALKGTAIFQTQTDENVAIAKSFVNQALVKDQDCEQAHSLMGSIYQVERNYSLAIAEFDKVIQLKPQKGGGYFDKAIILTHLGNDVEAKKYFLKAAALDSTVSVTFDELGNLEFRAMNIEAALGYYYRALKIDSTFYRSYFNIAIVNGDLQNRDIAICNLNKAIQLNPNYVKALKFRAELKAQEKDFEASCNDISAVKMIANKDESSGIIYSDLYLKMCPNSGNSEDPKIKNDLIYLSNSLKQPYVSSMAIKDMARIQINYLGSFNYGRDLLLKVIRDRSTDHETYYALAMLYQYHLHNNDSSLYYFNKAIEVCNEISGWTSAMTYYHKKALLLEVNIKRPMDALLAYERALEIYNKNSHSQEMYQITSILHGKCAKILVLQKRYNESLVHADKSLANNPLNVDALYSKALVLKKLGKIDEMKVVCNKLSFVDPLNCLGIKIY